MLPETFRPPRSRRLAALTLEEDRLALSVGRARDRRLEKVDFIEETPSAGLRSGMIADAELFADALDRLAGSLDQVSRSQRIDRIVCGIHGPFIHIQYLTRSFELPPGPPLTDDRIRALVHDTALRGAEDRVLLQVMPWRFLLDDYRETDRPAGLRADRLTVEALGVYAERAPFADLQDVLRELGLDAAELSLSSLAAARVALTAAEREDGVALLELAWDECRLSVYSQRRLYLHRASGKGLSALAEVLCRVQPMTPQEARRLMPTLKLSPEQNDPVSRAVRDFMTEALSEARRFLEESLEVMDRPPAVMSWVLTGAIVDASGVIEFAQKKMEAPVRRAVPPEPFRISGHQGSTAVTLLGLLDCAAVEPGVASGGVGRRAITEVRMLPSRVWHRLKTIPWTGPRS